jgi:hypothetical protein
VRARRQEYKFIALITRQKRFAGMNPVCAVRNPITQMITLLIAHRAQPSQQRRPSKMVDEMVRMQET